MQRRDRDHCPRPSGSFPTDSLRAAAYSYVRPRGACDGGHRPRVGDRTARCPARRARSSRRREILHALGDPRPEITPSLETTSVEPMENARGDDRPERGTRAVHARRGPRSRQRQDMLLPRGILLRGKGLGRRVLGFGPNADAAMPAMSLPQVVEQRTGSPVGRALSGGAAAPGHRLAAQGALRHVRAVSFERPDTGAAGILVADGQDAVAKRGPKRSSRRRQGLRAWTAKRISRAGQGGRMQGFADDSRSSCQGLGTWPWLRTLGVASMTVVEPWTRVRVVGNRPRLSIAPFGRCRRGSIRLDVSSPDDKR